MRCRTICHCTWQQICKHQREADQACSRRKHTSVGAKLSAKWLTLLLAEAIVILVAIFNHTSELSGYFVAILNGCLVYSAAVGLNAMTSSPPPTGRSDGAVHGRSRRTAEAKRWSGLLQPMVVASPSTLAGQDERTFILLIGISDNPAFAKLGAPAADAAALHRALDSR